MSAAARVSAPKGCRVNGETEPVASCVLPCVPLQAWLRLCSFGLTEMFEFEPVLFTLVVWN
jgi:hypothetical protein